MAPSRKRLTRPKKSRKVAWVGGDPGAPTHEQFGQMTTYGSFVITSDDESQHTFSKGDDALVHPDSHGLTDHVEFYEYWVVKIREIKAADMNNVWVRVQWYYSPEDVNKLIKSFDTNACGLYERIFSDHYDYLPSSCFIGSTEVNRYQESDLNQVTIEDEEFFCRYDFERDARKILPRPGKTNCICQKPYSPDNESEIMHFCPRPACRIAYHEKCLTAGKFKETATAGRELRLLASSPDTDDRFILTELVPCEPPVPTTRPKTSAAIAASLRLEKALLAPLPANLVKVAQQPIVKGLKAGGVVGNIKSVVQARRLVYSAIQGTAVPVNWDEEIDVEDAIVYTASMGRRAVPAFICPLCKGPI